MSAHRSGPRSAFDGNVVYQFEIMEYAQLEISVMFGILINHPVLITECACNPVQSRSKIAELLFESYGVPSVAFGVDAAFSYKYNQQFGICSKDGLAICSGFNTSHVIPENHVENGPPENKVKVKEKIMLRTNVGGYHVTDYLKQLLSLKYPHHMSKLTWEKVEDLKMEHCYIAPDYARKFDCFRGQESRGENQVLAASWTPTPVEEAPSEEEIARKAALKEKQGQRLREMAEAKRFNRINDLENEIRDLDMLLQRLRHGEPVESIEKLDPSSTEKYNLINVPDEMLTPDQLKQKRKQENPERYLEELRAKHRDLSEKVEQRKKLKTNGGHSNGNHNGSGGGVGRGERLNSSQRERMRLLTTAAFDRGKGEDTFGTKDEDWQLYKLMSRDNDDDDDDKPDPDEAELARISSRLQVELILSRGPSFRPLTKEDFQIILGVERFRCPEILFNPNLIGIEQAGLDEMAGISIRRLEASKGMEERITNSILLTGGSCLFPGMSERLEAGIE
ncbi:hypothetical protein DH2020_010443 [Rehmannia glutinosa]|uniref:Actin-related protein 5 n=1 Tax=Rehmannia glutinosa TaxID=99300 RepID=A0ABR0XAM1_REHGL